MFASIGAFTARRRKWVVIAAVVFTLFAGVWGTGVFGSFTGGAGFDDPASESVEADKVLAGPLGRESNDLIVLYESKEAGRTVEEFGGAVRAALDGVPRAGITRLSSLWEPGAGGADAYVSRDRTRTYATVQFAADDDRQQVEALTRIKEEFEAEGVTARFGGVAAMTEQVNALTGADIARAEMLSVPVLLVLLVLIFRSAVAALLPLAVGTFVALGSFVVLRVLTLFTEISGTVINVITILGLGLAIDYALFLVNRFREELHAGADVDTAVRRATATAGRTVAFSGLAVAISFAGLALFPSRFLSSMGYAAVSVVAFAVIGSLTLLPALLRYTGHRIDKWRIPLPGGRGGAAKPLTQGRWYRTARAVMRRPLLSSLAIVAVLVGLGAPLLGVNWARPGEWVLPSSGDAKVVSQALAAEFETNPGRIMTAVVRFDGPADRSAVEAYADRLEGVAGVRSAVPTAFVGNDARVTVRYAPDAMSGPAVDLVHGVRGTAAPEGAKALVTGMPASRVDIVDMIGGRLPWMALFVAVVSFLVLFLAFGSLLLPLKSVLLNLLSLLATFGAIKWIFQDGHLSGLLGFEPIGAVDANFPVLIVAIAFGLAMDYEVFLLSRVREEWEAGGDPIESMALGLQRTAKIITSAALLFVVVVGGFMTSSILFMKMIGVGLVIAVVVDATVVRGLLVPATMALMGKWAWWAPAPLARWWSRHGFREPAAGERTVPASRGAGQVGRTGHADEAAAEDSDRTAAPRAADAGR
ncbi:MMPL family transporter [Streptomyces sp. NBC_00335]|uniref:MMPL family transporter n=1 Tax=unclassified Streptomyces TaxID=2593676 RepID=UPI002258DDC1|nr:MULTISPECIES: MMPL family transporter [unclassified Streptomyces]MCX5405941.1 MMPL family transporter [Streptomyces sp. NBC_00086]